MAAPMFKVEITPPLRDMQGRYAKATKTLLKLRRDQLRDIGRLGVKAMQGEAPKKTGKFAKGIQFKTYERGTGGQMELRITDPQPLGKWIRGGTRPHIIVPVRAKCLHFFVKGREVFTKRVYHPGTKPNLYHERALKRIIPEIDKGLARLGRAVTQELAG